MTLTDVGLISGLRIRGTEGAERRCWMESEEDRGRKDWWAVSQRVV